MEPWKPGEVISTVLIISTLFVVGLFIEHGLWWVPVVFIGGFVLSAVCLMGIIGIVIVLAKIFGNSKVTMESIFDLNIHEKKENENGPR